MPTPPSTETASRRQIAKGTAWLMLFKIFDKVVGLISTLILARLLAPSDFGLVAMASSIVALTELMGAFGFDTALIQRQNASREHYDTAWTFNVIFGFAIACALIILTIPAATFYNEPRLTSIIPLLAIGALISGMENIGTVAFRKELNFNLEFRFLALKRISGFIVTIVFAFTLQTYWALIAGTITSKIVALTISYRLHEYRPKLSLAARADLFNFSKWLFISNLIGFLRSRSTDFILGRTAGTHGLGIFNVGHEIAMMPATEIVAPINRAVYPAYSKLTANKLELNSRFLEVFGFIALLTIPASFGLIAIAETAIPVLLGEKWLETIPIVRLVAIAGLAGALQSNLHVFILAIGKPKASTYLSAAILTISLPLIIFCSSQFGLPGTAFAYMLSACINLICTVVVFINISGIKTIQFVKRLYNPFFSTIAMTTLVYHLDRYFATNLPDVPLVAAFLACILAGGIIYTAMVIFIWHISGHPDSTEKILINFISKKYLKTAN